MFDIFPWLSAGLIIFCIMVLVFVPYAIARFFLHTHAKDASETLSTSIIVRTASLHGLILALIFAQEMVNILDLRQISAHEAASIADIFYDLDRYDPSKNIHLRRALAEYTRVVIEEEWKTLSDGNLSQSAWDLWNQVYIGILDLQPTSPREEALRQLMLADIDKISDSRDLRSADSNNDVPGLFWFVAIVGIMIVVFPYCVFPPSKINLLSLGSFALYNGIVIYTIYALSNPFASPGAISPSPFVEVYQQDMKKMLEDVDIKLKKTTK